MNVTIRKPTARELRGLQNAMALAEADAQSFRDEEGRLREAQEVFAGLMWLDEVLAKVKS